MVNQFHCGPIGDGCIGITKRLLQQRQSGLKINWIALPAGLVLVFFKGGNNGFGKLRGNGRFNIGSGQLQNAIVASANSNPKTIDSMKNQLVF